MFIAHLKGELNNWFKIEGDTDILDHIELNSLYLQKAMITELYSIEMHEGLVVAKSPTEVKIEDCNNLLPNPADTIPPYGLE